MIGARQLDWSLLRRMYLYKSILFVFWFVARRTCWDTRAESARLVPWAIQWLWRTGWQLSVDSSSFRSVLMRWGAVRLRYNFRKCKHTRTAPPTGWQPSFRYTNRPGQQQQQNERRAQAEQVNRPKDKMAMSQAKSCTTRRKIGKCLFEKVCFLNSFGRLRTLKLREKIRRGG